MDTTQINNRAATDVSNLWVELARAIKGFRYYPADHPLLGEMTDRSFRAWRADLDRHGPLELELQQGSLQIAGLSTPVGHGHTDELTREFILHSVQEVYFVPEMTLDGFLALVELLASDRPEFTQRVRRLEIIEKAKMHGVEISIGTEPIADSGMTAFDETDPLASLHTDDSDHDESDALDGTEGAEPAFILTALLEPDLAFGTSDPNQENPKQLENKRRTELLELLTKLNETEDEGAYELLAAETVSVANLIFEQGGKEEAYNSLLVLSSHASFDSEKNEKQQEIATNALISLASGPRLADLIARACTSETNLRIRATQLLLQLGEHAVPALLRSIETLKKLDHRSQIAGILIAIGEPATPYLIRTMEGENVRAARVAARLSGEIQNPAAVSVLRKLLSSPDPALSKEASKSLVLIGDATAIGALIHALLHERSEIAMQAAYWLGKSRNSYAVQPLSDIAMQATLSGDLPLAKEAIRALGRIDHPDGVSVLSEILKQRSFFKRQKLNEVKLVVFQALARIHGDEAQGILEEFAEGEDSSLRKEARRAFIQRAQGDSAP